MEHLLAFGFILMAFWEDGRDTRAKIWEDFVPILFSENYLCSTLSCHIPRKVCDMARVSHRVMAEPQEEVR